MAIAFKEWQVICDALAEGRQSVLLRKGGIHEGREGFSFAHDSFYLFPTKFHAQLNHVREGKFTPEREWQEGDLFAITHYAEALFAVTITDPEKLGALFPYHVYTGETLRERFEWQGKGMASGSIHLAFVRVCRLKEPIEIRYEKKFGGCRSWLEIGKIPEPESANMQPVMNSADHEVLRERIVQALS